MKNLLVLFMFFGLAGCAMVSEHTRKAYRQASLHPQFDAVIVPGYPYRRRSLLGLMKKRVLWSVVLYKQGMTKNIIYSGGAVRTPYREAVIMGLYAQSLGVPADHIFYDTVAQHSCENLYYGYLVAKSKGWTNLAVATGVWQSYFLKKYTTHHFRSGIYRLPIVSCRIRGWKRQHISIDPAVAKVDSFESIRDRTTRKARRKAAGCGHIDWTLVDQP